MRDAGVRHFAPAHFRYIFATRGTRRARDFVFALTVVTFKSVRNRLLTIIAAIRAVAAGTALASCIFTFLSLNHDPHREPATRPWGTP